MVMKVNDNATKIFIQQTRRSLSILERPLMTARGNGKCYIYANFNPENAQYALIILQTFYKFFETYKSADGKELANTSFYLQLLIYQVHYFDSLLAFSLKRILYLNQNIKDLIFLNNLH
jgi:hypothetical protein